jgi:hypothetical protein
VDETWQNLKNWQKVLRRPVYEDPNYFLSKRTWNFITTLVASREHRFKNISEIRAHEYFSEVDFSRLREQRPPFVPQLDSETDAGYFDDFENEADMAKYKEVHDKQRALEEMAERDEKMAKGLFVGFTFRFVPCLLFVNNGSNQLQTSQAEYRRNWASFSPQADTYRGLWYYLLGLTTLLSPLSLLWSGQAGLEWPLSD